VSEPPALSAAVVADEPATIAPLVRALAAQTGSDRVELVVGLPPGHAGERIPDTGKLHSVIVVPVPSIADLGAARVVCFKRATAPIVLLAETHAFPEPGWLEAVLSAHGDGVALAGPRFENANPGSAVSWANLIDHYGPSLPGPEFGVRPLAGHNSTMDLGALRDLGPDLEPLLRDFPELHRRLGEWGRSAFVAEARVSHLNISSLRWWLLEAWAGGRVYATARRRRWGWPRRLGYGLAWPLLAAVEIARRLRLLGPIRRAGLRIPRRTVPLLALGIVVRCLGEGVGYFAGRDSSGRELLSLTEIRRTDYLRSAERQRFDPRPSDSSDPQTAAAGSRHE